MKNPADPPIKKAVYLERAKSAIEDAERINKKSPVMLDVKGKFLPFYVRDSRD